MNEVYTQLELLTEFIRRTLSQKESGTSKKLMFFIRRSLSQMGLYNEWDESEILIEAYLRTREQIKSGAIIENLPSYLTRVSQLIIFEKRRQRKRSHGITQKLSGLTPDVVSFPEEASYHEEVSFGTISSLWNSFNSLPERDKQILVLRIVKGYSWKEIGYLLVEDGIEATYTNSLVTKLRKQGERALEKLRRRILSVNG